MRLTITLEVEGVDPTRVDPHDVAAVVLDDFDDQNVVYQLGRLGDWGEPEEGVATVSSMTAEWAD